MEIHPTILSLKDQQVLSDLADKSQDEALGAAVNSYLERSVKSSQSSEALAAEPEREQTDDDGLDTACLQWCAEQLQGQPPPSLEDVRQELSTIKGSLAAEIIAERDES